MWVFTFNDEQFEDKKCEEDGEDNEDDDNGNEGDDNDIDDDDDDFEDDDDDFEDCNDPDGWVFLMILFSPFDGSPLLNYWSTKRSIDDDANDDEEDGEEDGEGVHELLPSSLLCLALWVLAPPQRTHN